MPLFILRLFIYAFIWAFGAHCAAWAFVALYAKVQDRRKKYVSEK